MNTHTHGVRAHRSAPPAARLRTRLTPALTPALILAAASALLCSCDQPSSEKRADTSATPAVSPGPSSAIPLTVIPGIAGEPDLRVRLQSAIGTITLSSPVRAIWVVQEGAGQPATHMAAPVVVTLADRGWEFKDSSGQIAKFDRAADIDIAAEEGIVGPMLTERGKPASSGASRPAAASKTSPSSMVTLNGKSYPGFIRLSACSEAARLFDVVDTLPIEEYLKGVVAAEMFANWPLAAYQVQAVCARTYALHERSRARLKSARFDVESSVKDQAFNGASVKPEIIRAVNDTRGVVITWSGGLLRSYYSSTCGGRAASARDTWPIGPGYEYNLAGPLQAQNREYADEKATYYRWTVTRSRDELLKRFRAYGHATGSPIKNLTAIVSIQQSGTNVTGRPSRFIVMQPGGQTYTLTAEELRRACNEEVGTLPPITSTNRVHSGDLKMTFVDDKVLIDGQGFGHAVGMCQWCAKGFAEKGETWEKIVLRFYPGARLERAY